MCDGWAAGVRWLSPVNCEATDDRKATECWQRVTIICPGCRLPGLHVQTRSVREWPPLPVFVSRVAGEEAALLCQGDKPRLADLAIFVARFCHRLLRHTPPSSVLGRSDWVCHPPTIRLNLALRSDQWHQKWCVAANGRWIRVFPSHRKPSRVPGMGRLGEIIGSNVHVSITERPRVREQSQPCPP
ncbi:unnamed protein product [Protopolystoma xenopodis]|uniref:Uncharacterized protein n=1 Tax=Protopolystoma xenopodis TaxID=117903 RepID=A0A448X895_9PLAT|nr:unnamed protein product [Protopolystoma xenopodis]